MPRMLFIASNDKEQQNALKMRGRRPFVISWLWLMRAIIHGESSNDMMD